MRRRAVVADRIAELLQRERAEFIVGFPENRLLNSASLIGMRPIIARTERVAVNIADGFARMTNGDRITACAVQYGPGAESMFGAVAQAFGDRSPILLIPGEHDGDKQDSAPHFRAEQAFRPITRWAATLNDARRGPEVFRRALNALRGVRNGPVMVAVANDVLNQELPEADDSDWKFASSLPRLSQAAPEDVAETLRLLLSTPQRAILAGQGVLYADATQELVQLAELTNTPVATTLNGKSAFPENHPLALGTAARTRPATVARFFERAEVVLGIGTSFTRSLYITPMPPRARLGQIVNDPRGYMGWGKSTQLGTGLGLAMGARLARPDWLSVNVMGDAAFGMVGMDFETAVRCRIPILTIVLNNGLMGGYGEYMPDAVKAHAANRLTGDYTGVAKALGGYAERVTLAGDLAPAIERCAKSVKAGQAALLEVITREESDLAVG